MKPAPFDYHAPESLDEALGLLAEYGDAARPLAGGQSLVPAMNFRLAQPAVLVDLNRVDELVGIGEIEGGVRIGAMTRQRAVERSAPIATAAPLVTRTMPFVAHAQIRNRGTFGGSLAHADPAAELPAVALALDAELRLVHRGGERTVAARDFYVGLFETALEPGELLAEVVLPGHPSGRTGREVCAFEEFSRRRGDYALVGVAVRLLLDEDDAIRDARIALLSVGEGPVLAEAAQNVLTGEQLSASLFAEAADVASRRDIDPPSDIHASSAFRRHLARVLVERTLVRAAQVLPDDQTRSPREPTARR